MSTNQPTETSTAPPLRSRAHLFSHTFWQVLPTHQDKLEARWALIARLYHEASAAIMSTDRAAGVNSLKAELEMLDTDIKEYRVIIKGIDFDDLVGIYVAAGRQRWRAEQIARDDLEDVEKGLEVVEEKAREMRADMVYGFEKE